jgi:hypothetical protein
MYQIRFLWKLQKTPLGSYKDATLVVCIPVITVHLFLTADMYTLYSISFIHTWGGDAK